MAIANWLALPFRPQRLGGYIACALGGVGYYASAQEVQFNTDVLDVKDRGNIDLGQFARGGYIMPGDYMMLIRINKQELPEQSVIFYPAEQDASDSAACISPKMVEQFGLTPEMLKKVTWWHQGQCLSLDSLPGAEARADLGSASLTVSLPQAYLEYAADNWDPPSRWDDGIPGLLLDYYLNGQTQRQQQRGQQSYNVSGNGTVGANLGSWRLRADWQTRLDHQTGSGEGAHQSWDWSRYYAYRAISRLGAKLSVGENYLYSDIFDSFRFTGASLISDDSMLPPNLRGYAPEVTGVARTNAKVVISQQGRVLYETQVASGPFRIQDINDAISGQLEVRVEEQDGSVQEFRMDTASIPYLTRPGSVRYKVASGRPSDWKHRTNGPLFATGEFSWGVSNGWSLYGGGVAGGDYNALAVGVGRDLMMFGALSFDVTQSRARLPQMEDGTLTGGSYRLSYSKNFDETDSQVTFAGYRFSERNYMSMSEYLDARTYGTRNQNSKEMYTISFSQHFRDLGLSAYLNYNHQTYWNRAANDRYTLTLSRNFDIGRFRNLSLSLTGYRNKYNNTNDDGMYLSLSMPLGGSGSVSYGGSLDRNDSSHQVGYYDRLDNGDSYQLNSGMSRSGATASGYYTHQGDLAQVNANASYQEGRYSSAGLSLQGGATATLNGAALHRSGMMGGTRMLLDTDGVADIPIGGYGAVTRSNRFGKAVVTDVSSYYRNRVSIDVNKLPENAEATRSVVQATLTEGAIGYRRFEVIAGEKAMAVIRLADGSTPPFGATVQNHKKQDVGIVNDGGSVYLSGINPNEEMTVHWNGQAQCALVLPAVILQSGTTDLLLPCRLLPVKAAADNTTG
ncbi:outer membrane usher protein [Serratia fonticola]|uniref:outer membrane usher protein n=1 Tax=Serratia fonticola TaxID=47917 RepID=UPI001C47B98E|nr:outer membrane usher protein [Serratia fonticola]QXN62769.1 outer membrane usher protein [Serratia fonticola]